MLAPTTLPGVAEAGERGLRRQINRGLARALVEREYARSLFADPTLLLEDHGCTPQQFLQLRSIRAENLVDFARQTESLFWIDHSDAQPDPRRVLAAI